MKREEGDVENGSDAAGAAGAAGGDVGHGVAAQPHRQSATSQISAHDVIDTSEPVHSLLQ